MDIDKDISNALGQLINSYGVELLEKPDRLKGFLMDLLPRYDKERNLLLKAVTEGISTILIECKAQKGHIDDHTRRVSRKKLTDVYISEQASDMVIAWIDDALSVKGTLPNSRTNTQEGISSSGSGKDYKGHLINNLAGAETDNKKDKNTINNLRDIASKFLSHKRSIDTTLAFDCDEAMEKAKQVIFVSEQAMEIACRQYAEYSNLKTINFTGNILRIGREAFLNCKKLSGVVFPRELQEIGEGAFKGCESLTSIIWPIGIDVISTAVFKGCRNLINVNLPDTVISIADEAFRDCASLEDIFIPESVQFIGNRSFIGCQKLKNVTLTRSIRGIGRDAFRGCSPDFHIIVKNNANVIQYCLQNHIKYIRI